MQGISLKQLIQIYIVKVYELSSGQAFKQVDFKEIKEELGLSDENETSIIHYLKNTNLVDFTFGTIFLTSHGIIQAQEYMAEIDKVRDLVVLEAIYNLANLKANELVEHSKLANRLSTTVEQLEPVLNSLQRHKGYIEQANEGVWIVTSGIRYLQENQNKISFHSESDEFNEVRSASRSAESSINKNATSIRIPMKKKLQIFISSTYTDLIEERQAAVSAILKAGHIPAGMELFTAGDESQMNIIKEWIDESDIFMLILGGRYGSIEPTTSLSYTELEYDYAVSSKTPLFAVVINDSALERKVKKKGRKVLETDNSEKLKKFRDKVLSKMCEFFNDPRDIQLAIFTSLSKLSNNHNLKGWIPGDEIPDVQTLKGRIVELEAENQRLKNQISNNPNYNDNTSISANQVETWFRNYLKEVLSILEQTHKNFINRGFQITQLVATPIEMKLAKISFFDFEHWHTLNSSPTAKQFLRKFSHYKDKLDIFIQRIRDLEKSIDEFSDFLSQAPEFERKVSEIYENMRRNRNPNYPTPFYENFNSLFQSYVGEWLTQYINNADRHPAQLKKQFALIDTYILLELKLPTDLPFSILFSAKDLFEDLNHSEKVINELNTFNQAMENIGNEAKELNEELSELIYGLSIEKNVGLE